MNELIDFWPLWTYLIGFVWTWRYHVGYLLDDMAGGSPDGSDFCFALSLGTIATFFWPLTAGGRGVYVLWTKYGADNSGALAGFFPVPKEIESKEERRKRLEREKERELEQRERDIRAKERELGIGQDDARAW